MNSPSQSGTSNRRRLAVIMDPIATIHPAKDSTVAMLLAAQARGWKVYVAEMKDIWIRDGQACGRVTTITVADDADHWYEFGRVEEVSLGDLDVILMRKDPPFDMEYIQATYILERAEEQGALVVNRPRGLRDANEKTFVSWFPQCCPPTMISRSLADLTGFIDEQNRVVLKPLDQMAGRSVFVTGASDPNRNALLEMMTHRETRYVMAQMYIPDVTGSGDARILLIDGQPVPQALVRIPSGDDHRANISTGASVQCRPLTDSEQKICAEMGPILVEKGLLFVGIDVIGGYLTEINVTSPTGIRELDRLCDLNIAQELMQTIEDAHIKSHGSH